VGADVVGLVFGLVFGPGAATTVVVVVVVVVVGCGDRIGGVVPPAPVAGPDGLPGTDVGGAVGVVVVGVVDGVVVVVEGVVVVGVVVVVEGVVVVGVVCGLEGAVTGKLPPDRPWRGEIRPAEDPDGRSAIALSAGVASQMASTDAGMPIIQSRGRRRCSLLPCCM
jgi:hypothetical protein